MNVRLFGLLPLFCVLCLGPAAIAQPAPAEVGTEIAVVEDLVVRAIRPGPPWWSVSDADSTVFVLFVPRVMPRDLDWDARVLEARLEGANVLLLPPGISTALRRTDMRVTNIYQRLNTTTPLDAVLPRPLLQRFAAAAARVGKPVGAYERFKPGKAGLELADDFLEAEGFEINTPMRRVRTLAARQRVPTRQAAIYRPDYYQPMIDQLAGPAGQVCLSAMLDYIDSGSDDTRRQIVDWNSGDIGGLLRDVRSLPGCDRVLAATTLPMYQRNAGDFATAIEAALRTPGHSILVSDSLYPLIVQGGTFSQLRARGFEVASPQDVEPVVDGRGEPAPTAVADPDADDPTVAGKAAGRPGF